MITGLVGFFLSLWKNLVFLGYSLIEALVFMVAFNYALPMINMYSGLVLLELTYWNTFSIFVLIHFVGQFVSKLSPFKLSVSNNNKNE